MHPSYSVILFTVASGTGYGMAICLMLMLLMGDITNGLSALISLGLALALITIGLLASTFHLGHPERAWRAFSQWRTSWLSREGVMAVITYAPLCGSGLLWLQNDFSSPVSFILATASIICCLLTLVCTGMIYGSLKPIRAWHNNFVWSGYLLLALAGGAPIIFLITQIFSSQATENGSYLALIISAMFGFIALVLKIFYWRYIDQDQSPHNSGTATGLGYLGSVKQTQEPHTLANYLHKEMGYKIARNHSQKLRRLVTNNLLIGIFLLFLSFAVFDGLEAVTFIGCFSIILAIFIERWLFFAEAKHTVNLFYQ